MGNTVSVPGANSSVSVPPADAAPPVASWKEEYVANFTTIGTATYSNNQAVTIGGVDWTAVNTPDGATQHGEISSDGTGLTILSYGAQADNIINGITSPFFSFELSDAIPDLSDFDTIAIQVLCTELETRNNSWEGYGTALFMPGSGNLTAVTKLLYCKNWVVPGGAYDTVYWGQGGTRGAGSGVLQGGSVDDNAAPGIVNARNIVMETLFSFNGQTGVLGHAVSSSSDLVPYTPFAANRATVSGDVVASSSAGTMTYNAGPVTATVSVPATPSPSAVGSFSANTVRFGMGVFTAEVNVGDNYGTSFTKVRVLRLGGSGGGAV